MPWEQRVRGSLLLAAILVLAPAVGRSWLLADAAPSDVERLLLPIDGLGGGLLLAPAEDGWDVTAGRGHGSRRVTAGQPFELAGHRLQLDGGAGQTRAEILRQPWSVFASPTAGFRRIDVGPRPLGGTDGVRDRIVVPDDGGGAWFHLLPPRGERFEPPFEGVRLMPERAGLTVLRDGVEQPLVPGVAVPVTGPFAVRGPALTLEFRWERVVRTATVRRGGVAAYADAGDGLDLVVDSREAGGRSTSGVQIDGVRYDLPPGPVLVHGRGDQLRAWSGRVLPQRAAHADLEAAVADGLDRGWLSIDPRRATVRLPRDDDGLAGMTEPLAREVVALVETYERGRRAVALRVSGQRSVQVDGSPARFDASLAAWVPSDRRIEGGALFEVVADGPLQVESVLPGRWSLDRQGWQGFGSSDGWQGRSIPAAPGATAWIELSAPRRSAVGDRLAAAIVGAPDGTFFDADSVRGSSLAWAGWTGPDGAVADAAWDRLDGDRWRIDAVAPSPGRQPRSWFVRLPITARSRGGLALALTLPSGAAATWNGEALAEPWPAGEQRRSLVLRPGANLLTLRMELPGTAPAEGAGGVRFQTGSDGRPRALARRVVDRRARSPIRKEASPDPRDRTPRDGAALVVEAGLPGLESDAVWVAAPGAPSRLLLSGDVGLGSAAGRLLVDPPTWHNEGPPAEVTRRVAADPLAPPLPGFRVGRGQTQPLAELDSVAGPAWSLRRVAVGRRLDADLLVLRETGLLAFESEGLEPRGDSWIDLFGGPTPRVESSEPLVLWHRDGRREAVPPGEAIALVPGARVAHPSGLRLRCPSLPEQAELDAPTALAVRRSTVDEDLQGAATTALHAELARMDAPTEGLRGVLVALDARDGDILACAVAGGPPEACWTDAGFHPGSTFKLAVAQAALRSDDPMVAQLLRGEAPGGVEVPRRTLRGARLPGRDRRLRSELRNFRGSTLAAHADLDAALASSANTWFGYLGLLLHQPTRRGWPLVGIAGSLDRQAQWPVRAVTDALGFDRPATLASGVEGTLGSVPAYEGSDAAVAARSVGQDAVTASPLGVALLLAPALNDGAAPAPRLSLNVAPQRTPLLDAAAAARLAGAASAVITRGTGRRAFADHPEQGRLLGKSGSAQRVRGGAEQTDAWFVLGVRGQGDHPPVVLAVLLPGGGLGGRHAAEVADAFSRSLLRHQRRLDAQRSAPSAAPAPPALPPPAPRAPRQPTATRPEWGTPQPG